MSARRLAAGTPTGMRVAFGAGMKGSGAVRNGSTLLLDSCPVNSFCIASLVYGDSLVQQLQPDQPQEPMVYGRVR